MGLETGTYVNDLVTSNPVSSDLRAQGDDHLRLVKSVLKTTFPNASKAFNFPASVTIVAGNKTVDVTSEDNYFIPINASAASRTVTLPTADAGVTLKDGFSVWVFRTDGSENLVTVSAAQNINDATSFVMRRQYELYRFIYSLSNNQWYTGVNFLPYAGVNAKTADYTLLSTDHQKLIPVTLSAAVTITLPSTLQAGFTAYIVKANSNVHQLTLSAAANINGVSSLRTNRQYRIITVRWDGSTWWCDYLKDLTLPQQPSGRLTLTTATPVTTSDVSAASTVYYTPYKGGNLSIYDTNLTAFAPIDFSSELTLTLNSSHPSGNIYDVFVALNPSDNSTLIIGTGPAWQTATAGSGARGSGATTTELTRLQGLLVNAVSITLRNGSTTYSIAQYAATYIGSLYTTGSGTTEDSVSKRLLYNAYNQILRMLSVTDATDTWTYSHATVWQQAHSSGVGSVTTNKFHVLNGLLGSAIAVDVCALAGGSGIAATGIGINSTSVNSAQVYGGFATVAGYSPIPAKYRGHLTLGYHDIYWLEVGSGVTWYGDGGFTILRSGMVAEVLM